MRRLRKDESEEYCEKLKRAKGRHLDNLEKLRQMRDFLH